MASLTLSPSTVEPGATFTASGHTTSAGVSYRLLIDGVQAYKGKLIRTTTFSRTLTAPTGANRVIAVTLEETGYSPDNKKNTYIQTATANLTIYAAATPPPDDSDPPVLSAITVTGITTSAADVTWTTSEAATGQVHYGTTTGLGSDTVLDDSLATSQSASLSGLTDDTTYYFTVESADALDNAATSPVSSFRTAAEPVTPPSGWTLAFSDDFTTWDPSRYFVYPLGWHDTKGTGVYTPSIISSDGNILRIHIQTVGGVHQVAAFCPLPTGRLSNRGDLLSAAVEFRIRADLMVGYKGVPLMWPMSGHGPYTYDSLGNPTMEDGELDIYESDFNVLPKAFTHHQGAIVGNDQDYFLTPGGTSWQDWHTIRCEWIAGVSANYWIDGTAYTPQRSTSTTYRIPSTPMHLVMQFETTIEGTAPSNTVTGYVEIDYLRVWSRV